MSLNDLEKYLREQSEALFLSRQGMSHSEIAKKLGISKDAVYRRIKSAKRAENIDPQIRAELYNRGMTDLNGLRSGWLIQKDEKGAGTSLYFDLGPDNEKISFAEAILNALEDIPKLDSIEKCRETRGGEEFATWLALADLHVGGDYGNPKLEVDFNRAIDDLVGRLPKATHAVLFELGDLLEANDHKGVTPNSGNPLDVKREDHLKNTTVALKLLRRAIYRLLETHDTVEVHIIKGNHDPTAYIAVMIALAEHFAESDRVKIVVSDDDYRVVTWGQCAAFPNHGDKLKWEQLKDVWTDQFPDEWAAAKAHRLIMTAHFHHDRRRDLVGCTAEHYRTLHGPNKWAKGNGFFSRGSLTAMTVHLDEGEQYRTVSNIRPTRGGI